MGIGLDFAGSGQYIAWDHSAGQVSRYSQIMCWLAPDHGASHFAMAKYNSFRIQCDYLLGNLQGSIFVNGSQYKADGPAIVSARWYHVTLWFNHGTNAVNFRVYDTNSSTATTYASSSMTPSTWDSEADTLPLYVAQGEPTYGNAPWAGLAGAYKIFTFADSASMMTEAQIDAEKWTWWPQRSPEKCTFAAPLTGLAVELNYGTMTDKTGTTTGSPTAVADGPPGVHQLHPAQYRYRPTRLRM